MNVADSGVDDPYITTIVESYATDILVGGRAVDPTSVEDDVVGVLEHDQVIVTPGALHAGVSDFQANQAIVVGAGGVVDDVDLVLGARDSGRHLGSGDAVKRGPAGQRRYPCVAGSHARAFVGKTRTDGSAANRNVMTRITVFSGQGEAGISLAPLENQGIAAVRIINGYL